MASRIIIFLSLLSPLLSKEIKNFCCCQKREISYSDTLLFEKTMSCAAAFSRQRSNKMADTMQRSVKREAFGFEKKLNRLKTFLQGKHGTSECNRIKTIIVVVVVR